MSQTPALQQISLSLSSERNAIAPATAASLERRNRDLRIVREAVHRATGGEGLSFRLHERHSPFNICVSQRFANHVRSLHRLLNKALIDVVDRWFGDQEAQFSKRMPLEKHEEDLLRWMSGKGSDLVPSFAKKFGMWRTDYLIERDPDGLEQAKICEINSRIPFNGLYVSGLLEEATSLLKAGDESFKPLNDFQLTKQAILGCFDTTKPLYHIREKWPGVDSHPLSKDYSKRHGQPMLTIKPSELRLEPNQQSATGYSLFFVPEPARNGEANMMTGTKHKIDQCSLELFQEEYEMDPLLLQQIATCSVNDLRNVFLIHDKRILGIIGEELPNLEARGILTANESAELRNGIADTLLAGSERLRDLLEKSKKDDTIKDKYIIKPARDAIGRGIRLAKYLSQQEWLDLLEKHAAKPLLPSEGACVVQRLAEHIWYDIVRHDDEHSTKPEKFHLIGSQQMINPDFDVYTVWRLGDEVHIGVNGMNGRKDLGIVMSSVIRPEGVPELGDTEE